MKTALRAAAFGLLAIAAGLVYGLVQALRGLNELEERRRSARAVDALATDPYFSERAHRELVDRLR